MGKAVRYSIKTVFRIDYKPSLDFYDRLYGIAQSFSSGYPDWVTDRLKVTLRDLAARRSLLISHKASVYRQDAFDSSSKESESISRLLAELPAALGKDSFLRVGLRRKYLLPAEMEYSELVELFGKKMLSSNSEFHAGLFPRFSDLSLVFNFQPPGFTAITVAPVFRRQLSEVPQILELQLEDHFKAGDDKLRTGQIFEEYPLHSVFLDVDYAETNVAAAQLTPTYEAACDAHDTFVENARNYLFGVG